MDIKNTKPKFNLYYFKITLKTHRDRRVFRLRFNPDKSLSISLTMSRINSLGESIVLSQNLLVKFGEFLEKSFQHTTPRSCGS